MGDLGQLNAEGARQYSVALKIPLLAVNEAARLANADSINKASDNYQAGHAAGAAECAERLEAERARIAEIGGGLKTALRDIEQRCRNECADLIEQLIKALAPSIARQSALAEINAIIQKNAVRKKQPITIRLHPALADDLAMREAEDVTDTAKITIETDDQQNANAVNINWTTGGMFFDPDALIADILRVLAGEIQQDKE